MVRISEEAIAVLHETLHQSGLKEGNAFRLAAGPEGLGLEIGVPSEADRVIEHGDDPVLFIEPTVEQSLGDAVIEIAHEPETEGARLVIRRF